MKAARLTKITTGLTKYSLVTILLSGGLGIACGAQTPGSGAQPNTTQYATPNAGNTAAPDLAAIAGATQDTGGSSPQMQAAVDRVTKAKADLDLAHKRLSASKAILKAADAEFKAAKADQQALSLQTQAQQLASASGMTENTGMPGMSTGSPVTQPGQAASVQSIGNSQNVDNAGQPLDLSGGSVPAPYTTVPTPGK